MTWIQPLELETWMVNVFSGSIGVFTSISIIFIFTLAGYLRMTTLNLILMLGVFFVLFRGYVDQSIYFLIITIGSLLVGFWIRKSVTTQ